MKFIWIVINFKIFQSFCLASSDILGSPKFSSPIDNITVPVGREAILTCKVHDLMTYKIAWLRVDTQTILTIQNQVITKNHRIGIIHTEHRIWQLRIREVREQDRGWYMCQLNTDPMKSQVGYLDIVVPPDIIDEDTSHDIIVDENQNVTLVCKATGLPPPVITWKREKERAIIIDNISNNSIISDKEVYSIEGEYLLLMRIQRHHMGAYFCIASNGVPPSISKRILIVVNFAPTIWTPHEKIYAHFGQKIVLECISESHPTTNNYWLKDKEFIQGGTYESVTLESVYKIVMRLTIRPLKTKDFGDFKCIAKNLLGESMRTITIKYKSKSDNLIVHPETIMNGNNLVLYQNHMSSAAITKSFYLTIWFNNIILLIIINQI